MIRNDIESSADEVMRMNDDIVTDEELIKKYGKQDNNEEMNFSDQAKQKMKSMRTCSRLKFRKILHSVLPITSWLPKYKVKEKLLGDIIGGITVGIVHLPQGMAYSLLAGLPPINGLYVSFFPVLMYVIFGTTHHLSIGTFAVVSLMVGAVIDKFAPSSCNNALLKNDFLAMSSGVATRTPLVQTGNSTLFSVTSPANCEEEIFARKIDVAIGLSLAIALIHFAMYIFRLGIVTIYLSSHMVSGYTCGAAFHVLTSQVPKLLGQDIPRKSGVLSLVYTYIEVFKNLNDINWATVIISLCCIVFLFIGKEINFRCKAKLPFPLPWELVLVIISTVASEFGLFNQVYDVDIVSDIPQGIKTSLPSASDMGLVFVDAIPIAIVIFSVSISLSRLLSEKHGYEVDANQELLAYAVANAFGSFFQCFPSASSLSRSLIWDETGGNTQLTGLVSSAIILVILLWIGPLFEALPHATLASVIVVNLKRLLKQFSLLKSLWKVSKLDAVTWFVSWLSVVLLGVDLGLYVGVGFSLFTVVLRTQIASGNVLVSIGNTGLYKSIKHFEGNISNDVLVFKFSSPLIYANQERFKNQFYKALGFKPALEVARREKLKKNLDSKKSEKEADTLQNSFVDAVAVNIASTADDYHNPNNEKCTGKITHRKLTKSLQAADDQGCSSSQHCNQNKFSVLHSTFIQNSRIILDMSACSFIDNDGVKTLKTLYEDLFKLQIHLMLSRCSTDVRKALLAGNFAKKSDVEIPVFFVSLKQAVAFEIDSFGKNDDKADKKFKTIESATRL